MSHLHPDPMAALALIGLPSADSEFIVATAAGVFAYESGGTVRTSLGLSIGSDVQAYGAVLDNLNTLGAPAVDGEFLVATGAGVFTYETGTTARSSMGAQTQGDVLDDLNTLGAASADGEFIVATASGVFAYESGTTARTSLGLAIGTDVQAQDDLLQDIADIGSTWTDNTVLVGTGAGTAALESGATLRTSLGLAIGTDVQAQDDLLQDIADIVGTFTDDAFLVGTGAGTAALETGATVRTSLGLGTGDNVQFTDGQFTGSVVITQDLTVNGTTTTINSEDVLLAENYLQLNTGYTADAPQAGGIVVNYDPTTTVDTSATGGFATTTTVITAGSGTFSAGQIIGIWDADNPANNGYYEVASHTGTTLTIDSTPQETFTKTAFVVDATDTTANITNTAVSVLQVNSGSGGWETAQGSTVPLSFSALSGGLLSSNNTWTGTNDFQDEITTEAINRKTVTVTGSSYTVLASDHIIISNATAAAQTIDLPAATGSGRELVIKRAATSTQNCTIDGNVSETIDGSLTEAISQSKGSITIIDHATGLWAII